MRCLFDVNMMDVCQPSSSPEDDAIKGKWVRVPRDLNFQAGMWQLVRRKFLLVFTIWLKRSVYTAHVLSSYSPTRRHAHLGHTTASEYRYTIRRWGLDKSVTFVARWRSAPSTPILVVPQRQDARRNVRQRTTIADHRTRRHIRRRRCLVRF